MTEIKTTYGISQQSTDALYIRFEVFVNEQHISRDDELDLLDDTSYHMVAYLDNHPVATARLHEDTPHVWHIQRVATLKNYRTRGIGRELFDEIARLASGFGIHTLTLGAQLSAKGFYEKLGFQQVGETFLDANIPHITMTKEVS